MPAYESMSTRGHGQVMSDSEITESPKLDRHNDRRLRISNVERDVRVQSKRSRCRDGQTAFSKRFRRSPEEEEALYRQLYERMLSCESYRAYRMNSDDNPTPKWPESHERMFIRALVKFPACGRTQISCPQYAPAHNPNKMLGRNEVIAGYMMKHLNVDEETFCRNQEKGKRAVKNQKNDPRKVISSHLQVLRNKFRDDRYVMEFIGRRGRKQNPKHAETPSRRTESNPYSLTAATNSKIFQLPSSGMTLRSHARETPPMKFRPAQFAIFISKDGDDDMEEESDSFNEEDPVLSSAVHIVTRLRRDHGNEDWKLEAHQDWRSEYPRLHDLQLQGKIPTDCSVYLAESSLVVRTSRFSDHKLLVLSTFNSGERAPEHVLQCSTKYFNEQTSCLIHENKSTMHNGCTLSMGSDWWVLQYQEWAEELRRYRMQQSDMARGLGPQEGGPEDTPEVILQRLKANVQNMTALQVVTAHDPQAAADSLGWKVDEGIPVLIIFWQFTLELSRPGLTNGNTHFRKLSIPMVDGIQPQTQVVDGSNKSKYLPEQSSSLQPGNNKHLENNFWDLSSLTHIYGADQLESLDVYGAATAGVSAYGSLMKPIYEEGMYSSFPNSQSSPARSTDEIHQVQQHEGWRQPTPYRISHQGKKSVPYDPGVMAQMAAITAGQHVYDTWPSLPSQDTWEMSTTQGQYIASHPSYGYDLARASTQAYGPQPTENDWVPFKTSDRHSHEDAVVFERIPQYTYSSRPMSSHRDANYTFYSAGSDQSPTSVLKSQPADYAGEGYFHTDPVLKSQHTPRLLSDSFVPRSFAEEGDSHLSMDLRNTPEREATAGYEDRLGNVGIESFDNAYTSRHDLTMDGNGDAMAGVGELGHDAE